MNYLGNNQMINQLMRQRDNIDNLIGQYSSPAPIQNFISTSNAEFEAKVLTNGEDISNIMINKRTLFVDEKNSKVIIKELDGTISKTYEIIVPKDEKDEKIEKLQKEIEKLKEVVENGKPTNTQSIFKVEQSTTSTNKPNGK